MLFRSLDPNLRAGLIAAMDAWLALDLLKVDAIQALTPEQEALLKQRADARAAKDFAASDRLRDALGALGILVKDTKQGQEWSHGTSAP